MVIDTLLEPQAFDLAVGGISIIIYQQTSSSGGEMPDQSP